MGLLTQMVPRGLVSIVIAGLIATYAPFITNVNITYFNRHAGLWVVEGTLTIDTALLPEEYTMVRTHPDGWTYIWYNHDENGMLLWWETHPNEAVAQMGLSSLVYVENLSLWWVQIGEDGIDIIGFHIELRRP